MGADESMTTHDRNSMPPGRTKKSRVALVVGLAVSAFVRPVSAADYSDAELTAAQIGIWMVPQDSSDATSWNRNAREIYRADGTVTTYFYSESNCGHLTKQIEQHWKIQDGIEIAVVDATGFTMRDKIIEFTKNRLTILSLDDGTTYTRERAAPCDAPTS